MKIKQAPSRSFVVLYLVTLICFLLILAPADAIAAYLIKQLNPNGHLSSHGDGRQLNDKGQVVWYGWDGSYYQIYFYDGATTNQITNDAYDNGYDRGYKFGGPDINQLGEFVWVGFYNPNGESNWRIRSYKDGALKQINNQRYYCNNLYDNFPRININGDVVWTQYIAPGGEIFLYTNNNNNVKQITNTGKYNNSPRINDNGDIVWSGHISTGNWGIYSYSLEAQKLIYQSPGQKYLNLNNNCLISFLDNSTINYDNYLYTGTDIIKLSTYPGNDNLSYPHLNINGSVVWRGYNGTEIFLYDGITTKKLSGNNNAKYQPNINDVGQVVWGEAITINNYTTNYVIYLYSNGVITPIYQSTRDQDISNLQINNKGQVIWEDGGHASIYLATPTDQPIISASLPSLNNTSTRGVNAPSKTIEVWNSGDGTLNYTIAADVTWLSCIPNSGISTGNHVTIKVNFLTTNLDYGKYNANLIITDTNAINNPVKIPVTLTITETSLNAALDNNSLAFLTGGNAPWFPQTTIYYFGGSSAQSGHIGDNKSSSLQTTLNGPGTLSFYWKVSSEPNADYLEFYMDGALQSRISGDIDWGMKNYSIPPGSHIIKWVYRKDGSVALNADCGWVDKVVYKKKYGGPIVHVLMLLLLD